MGSIESLIGKFKRAARISFPLPFLYLRYCVYILSGRKICAKSIHEFSQLLVFSAYFHRLPGMTTDTERAYFQWYAQHIYVGTGALVDLGCWLGSTTISLAKGLAKNKIVAASSGKIHAYDEFIWRDYMQSGVKGSPLQGKLNVGNDFVNEFYLRTTTWKDQIVVHQGDLSQMKWNGGAIEFLLIDAMKSWSLTNNIIRAFFPSLKAGESFILHQDFAHWFTPWIHLSHFRLCEFFEYSYEVPRSGSVVFKLIKPIPFELMNQSLSFSSFTRDEVDAAFNYSFSLVSREKHPNIAAAKVMVFLHIGELGLAQQELELFRTAGLSFNSDLSIVEKRIRSQNSVN
ncbi:MAG: hypothetical protein KC643_09765 [Nitrospira sp.]|nr:hypothetical protein [Nitrospira sp.]